MGVNLEEYLGKIHNEVEILQNVREVLVKQLGEIMKECPEDFQE